MDKEFINKNYLDSCGYGTDPNYVTAQLGGSIEVDPDEPEDEIYEDEYIYPRRNARFDVYIDTDYDNPDKEYDEDFLEDINRQAAVDAWKAYKSAKHEDTERYQEFVDSLGCDDYSFYVNGMDYVEEGFLISAYDYIREEMYKIVVNAMRHCS